MSLYFSHLHFVSLLLSDSAYSCFPCAKCPLHPTLYQILSIKLATYHIYHLTRDRWSSSLIWNVLRTSVLNGWSVGAEVTFQSGTLDCNIPSNPHGNNLGLSCCDAYHWQLWNGLPHKTSTQAHELQCRLHCLSSMMPFFVHMWWWDLRGLIYANTAPDDFACLSLPEAVALRQSPWHIIMSVCETSEGCLPKGTRCG